MKANYLWNFDLTKYADNSNIRQSKVMEMLDEVRKMRDETVSNKKKV